MKTTHIADTNLGVYLALSEGNYIIDEDENFLCIQAMRGDKKRVMELIHAAKGFGLKDITVEFRPDQRKISNDEFEEQMDRLKNGITPDKYDIGHLLDQYNEANGK
jgi:hypothetical protein